MVRPFRFFLSKVLCLTTLTGMVSSRLSTVLSVHGCKVSGGWVLPVFGRPSCSTAASLPATKCKQGSTQWKQENPSLPLHGSAVGDVASECSVDARGRSRAASAPFITICIFTRARPLLPTVFRRSEHPAGSCLLPGRVAVRVCLRRHSISTGSTSELGECRRARGAPCVYRWRAGQQWRLRQSCCASATWKRRTRTRPRAAPPAVRRRCRSGYSSTSCLPSSNVRPSSRSSQNSIPCAAPETNGSVGRLGSFANITGSQLSNTQTRTPANAHR